MKVDLVRLNIFNNIMVSICREMGITLMKTAYSTIFNEGLDFTCALADPEGNMLAVAEFCPAQIGAMPVLIDSCIREIPLSEMEPGDVVLHNDPYRGGCHIPEHTVFKPVYFEGEPVALAVSIGHIAEVGGRSPAAFCGDATEIFQEGLRIPPVKLKRRGKDVEEVWKIMLANVRTPRVNYGDLRALISSIDIGERRFTDVLKKYGKDVVLEACRELLDYSERRMRAEIEQMPDGEYEFEDYIENDGIEDKVFTIKANVIIEGSSMVVDYTGSSKQARGPINATYGVTVSATYNAILHVTDFEIPKNSGCFRPIKVVAPPGTVVNVDYPGPEVGGNTETHPRIALTVMGALSKAVPGRVMACDGGTHINFVFGGYHPDYQEYYACYNLEGVGWGGRDYADGNDVVDSINGNCRLIPVEVFETRFPWTVKEFSLHVNSAGAGRYRGGLGSVKAVEANAEIIISQLTDRHKLKPWGLFDGQPGANGATLIKKRESPVFKTIQEEFGTNSSSKFSYIPVRRGDIIKLVTPGGGGYGNPRERELALVVNDVEEGFITPDHAKEYYGVDAEKAGRRG